MKIKKYLLLITAFLFFILLNTNVQAMTVHCNDKDYDLPDFSATSHYVLYNFTGTDSFVLYAFSDENWKDIDRVGVFDGGDRSYLVVYYPDEGSSTGYRIDGEVSLDQYDLSGNEWVIAGPYAMHNTGYLEHSDNRLRIEQVVYSSDDIYGGTVQIVYGGMPSGRVTEGDKIFPQVNLVLAPILEEKPGEMEKTLIQIVAILPMILVLVVSFLGLHKALSMLSTLLRQS